MKRIEKETLQAIDNYKDNIIKECERNINKRRYEIKEDIQKDFDKTFEISKLEDLKAKFEDKYNEYVQVKLEVRLYDYNSNYENIYNEDKIIIENKELIEEIKTERRKMKLALQCYDQKSSEYIEALDKLYNSYKD